VITRERPGRLRPAGREEDVMRRLRKIALLGAGLIGAVAIGGCESDYTYDRDHGYYRSHDNDDHDRDHRHWVCDSDGDNCHWER
jgi:hypothetical protein